MFKRILLTLCALLLPTSVMADDLEGAWALRIDDATIFRFELREIADGVWRGTWTRPDSFGTNGAVFSRLEGEEQLSSMAGLEVGGEIELTFDDPRPGAVPDIFRFRQTGDGQAQLQYVGTRLAPYPLVQVAPGTPLGPFEEDRVYDRDNAVTISDYEPEAGEQPVVEEEAETPESAVVGPENGEGFGTGEELEFDEAFGTGEPAEAPEAPEAPEAEETEIWPPPEWSVEVWEDEDVLAEDDTAVEAQSESSETEPLIGDDFLDGL